MGAVEHKRPSTYTLDRQGGGLGTDRSNWVTTGRPTAPRGRGGEGAGKNEGRSKGEVKIRPQVLRWLRETAC